MLRWKEGQPLPPTAVVVSSRDAKDVAMLSNHNFQLPWMLFCTRRSLELVAVLAQIISVALLLRLKCPVKVKGRPAIATHSCCRVLK